MKRKTRHRVYHGPHGDRWLKAIARTTTSPTVRDVATRLIEFGLRNPLRYSEATPAGQVAACAFLARQAIGVWA